MTNACYGPTVAEYARSRIREIKRLMEELEGEKRLLVRREARYSNSMMLESERRATEAEKFMTPIKYREEEEHGSICPCCRGSGDDYARGTSVCPLCYGTGNAP